MGAIWQCIRGLCGLAGSLLRAGTGAALLLAAAAGVARAQTLSSYFPAGVPGYDTMPGVTVLSRARPDYQPLGIPVGDFVVSPSIAEGVGYDSNVLGGSGSPGSWTVGTHPSVQAHSDWSSDAVSGILGLDDTRYLDTPSQSRTDATAAFGGTLAVGRDNLTLAAAYLDRHEDRTALDALPSDTPVAFRLFDARIDYTMSLARLSLTPNLDFSGIM
jgi:hypothetical protein